MHFQSFIPKLCVISHTHQELNLSHLHITSFKPWFKRPFFQRDLGIGYVTQRPNKHKQRPFEEHEVFLETPKSLKKELWSIFSGVKSMHHPKRIIREQIIHKFMINDS